MFVGKHIANITADLRINPLSHEQCTAKLAPVTVQVRNAALQPLAEIRELARSKYYDDDGQNQNYVNGLQQAFHWISDSSDPRIFTAEV